MKTTWRTMRDYRTAQAKRREFEQETGLKWDYYSTGQGMRFTPIVTKETNLDPQAAEKLEPHLDFLGSEFVGLAERTGLPLADVLEGAKALVHQGKAWPMTNRMGNFAGIRRRQ